tara:strand:- start:137 stop:1090 length:954 start_codon:yes stop_codon:yes gene_type:complete
MNILVTGSSGFIGFHLVNNLLSSGHHVTGIDNHNDYYDPSLKEYRNSLLKSNNFIFYKQDINDLSLKNSNFDIAINLAAQAGVRVKKEKQHLYEHSNIFGFESFCEFCIANKVKKVLYASSSSVYADSASRKFTENVTNLNPKSLYGQSKLLNETYASELVGKYDISIIGLRFFSVYGPLGRPDMAYYLFTKALKNNLPVQLHNNGNMLRDMTYIDDIIQGINGAISYLFKSKRQIKNEIFNLGNDQPISTNDVLNIIEKKLNKISKVQDVQITNESIFTHADISRAKNLLGYQPRTKFENGIEKFLRWYEAYYENL